MKIKTVARILLIVLLIGVILMLTPSCGIHVKPVKMIYHKGSKYPSIKRMRDLPPMHTRPDTIYVKWVNL